MFARWNWRWYLAVGVIGGCVASVHAVANNLPKRHVNYFDLPSQALQISLIEFGLQAGVTIVADNRLLEGQRSSPIVGPHNIESALGNLLSATRLTYRLDEATNTYIIQLDPAAEKIAAEPIGSPSATVPTEPVIEGLLVKSTRYPFRYQTVTNSQMLGDLPYFDSSRFINLLPGALIEDLQPKEVGDLLKYASSITPGDGLADSNDDVFVRGFQRSAMYVDGFRLSDATGVKLIPASIERAEILKGPSTLLFGQAEPGGIVNLVRKKPKDETFLNTEVGVGSYGRRFMHVDANSSQLNDIDVRVLLVNEVQNDGEDASAIERQLIAPSVTWHIADATQITASYEHQQDSRKLFGHIPLFGFEDFTVYSDQLAKTARSDFTAESDFFSVSLSHYFSDNWTLSAQYFWRDETRLGVRSSNDNLIKNDALYSLEDLQGAFMLYSLFGRVSIPTIYNFNAPDPYWYIGEIRSIYDEKGFETNNNIKLRIDGLIEFESVVHHLSIGGEWYRQDVFKRYDIEKRNLFTGVDDKWDSQADLEWDVENILATIIDPNQSLGAMETMNLRLLYDDYGIYTQDVIELNDEWLVTIGGRYSYLEGEHMDVNPNVVTKLQTYENVSSQIGLVYKSSDATSIYASYSEALRANYHLDDVGSKPVDPELSNQFEVGIKNLSEDGRAMMSVGVFQINKSNVFGVQILSDGVRTLVEGTNQRVRGIDVDITYQVSPSVDLLVGGAMTDAKFLSGFNQGNRPALVADYTFSLFSNFHLTNGMNLSAGMKMVGERHADDVNEVEFDAYRTIDISLSRKEKVYEQEVKWQLGVTNLLDEDYFTAATMGANVNFAEGRAIVGSVQVGW